MTQLYQIKPLWEIGWFIWTGLVVYAGQITTGVGTPDDPIVWMRAAAAGAVRILPGLLLSGIGRFITSREAASTPPKPELTTAPEETAG